MDSAELIARFLPNNLSHVFILKFSPAQILKTIRKEYFAWVFFIPSSHLPCAIAISPQHDQRILHDTLHHRQDPLDRGLSAFLRPPAKPIGGFLVSSINGDLAIRLKGQDFADPVWSRAHQGNRSDSYLIGGMGRCPKHDSYGFERASRRHLFLAALLEFRPHPNRVIWTIQGVPPNDRNSDQALCSKKHGKDFHLPTDAIGSAGAISLLYYLRRLVEHMRIDAVHSPSEAEFR